MSKPGVSYSAVSPVTSLLVRIEQLLAWAENTPGLPEDKLLPIRRAARDLRGRLDAREAQKPLLPPGISPFLPQSDPLLGSGAALRGIMAEAEKAVEDLFDLYIHSLAALQGEPWERARRVMGDFSWTLGWAEWAARLLP